jgi:uncharacterized protein YcbK (DUF882 family)
MNKRMLDTMNEFRRQIDTPLIVTSAYRCPNHPVERAKKGKVGQHVLGLAVDWYSPKLSMKELYEEVEKSGLFNGVGVPPRGNFIHCDIRDRRTRWQYDSKGEDIPWDGKWESLILLTTPKKSQSAGKTST